MSTQNEDINAAIVLVAKCPIPGKSKSRLVKDARIGNEGAVMLAKAMLSDVLYRVTMCSSFQNILKVLLYAPGTKEGEAKMSLIVDDLKIKNSWILMPMLSDEDLSSSELGTKLKDALVRIRQQFGRKLGVLFIGMDSPDIPLDEIYNGLVYCSPIFEKAFLCPTEDGGYGMIGVPHCAPLQIFDGIRWSNKLTFVSQMKSLTDWGCSVVVGKLMYDVDEPVDVEMLVKRLSDEESSKPCQNQDCLVKPSLLPKALYFNQESALPCKFTMEALYQLGYF